MTNLKKLCKIPNLRPEDREAVSELVSIYQDKVKGNEENTRYYNDQVKVKNLGIAVPKEFEDMNTSCGWASKVVDLLAVRSIFDGISGDYEGLQDIIAGNDIAGEYQRAVTSELTHSCGLWSVSAGKVGEPDAVIMYHDAESVAMRWDYRLRRIKDALVVADVRKFKNRSTEEAALVFVHLSDAVIVCEYDGKDWHAEYMEHSMQRPMVEPMMYRPSYRRPFGKSRISRSVKGIVDEMQREILRTALHSELFSAPQKYLLGVDEEAFEASKVSLYMDALLIATRDADGNLPEFGQLTAASIEPHIAAMEELASRMASESHLPVAAFGVRSNGYTSSDALRAANDDIILEAESLNQTNGKALRNVAVMALAISNGISWPEALEQFPDVAVHWRNPAMPSITSQTDAMIKLASVVDGFAGTDVFWEQVGFNEEVRGRIESETAANRTAAAVDSVIFGGGND